MASELSCPAACGILVPRPGIEPTSPALQGEFLATGPPGRSPLSSLHPSSPSMLLSPPPLSFVLLLCCLWATSSLTTEEFS